MAVHITYLHGFRSSPQSFKAQLLAARMREQGREANWWCPQLSASPREAVEQLLDLNAPLMQAITRQQPVALIGSSLGGYYATVLAEQLGCKAVLLNPAIEPARDLAPHVGVQTFYHSASQSFEFKREYVDELAALWPTHITKPKRYFLIAATGDEVLDYREMLARYAGCTLKLIEGSDHGISEFADYVSEVLAFCTPGNPG
jgi:predicted esterase YcpF (UPF0227 family)